MTIPVSEILDLSWVEFLEEHGDKCSTFRAECSNEAVWRGYFEFLGCPENNIVLYCQGHKEVIDDVRAYTDIFWCGYHSQPGNHMGTFKRWERISK